MLLRLLPIFLILVSTSEAIAQVSSCQPAKIAFYVEVDLGAKDGVARLIKAEEFAASHCIFDRSLLADTERLKAEYENRRKLVVGPILSDLQARMAEISRSNEFTLFEGVALDERKFLLALDRRLDITPQLILHLNNASFKLGREASIDVPALMVGLIDSRKLYGSEKSLTGFQSVRDFDAHCSGGNCKEIFDQLQNFTIEKKYGAIFDSGRDLPDQIKDIACHDATDQFIEYFNRNTASPKLPH